MGHVDITEEEFNVVWRISNKRKQNTLEEIHQSEKEILTDLRILMFNANVVKDNE